MSQTSGYSALHHDPDGPGHARPNALDIVEDESQQGRLANQVMLITGCSPGGLGVEVARALHLTGKLLSVALTLLRMLRKLMPCCSEFSLDHCSVLVLNILLSVQHHTSPTNEFLHMLWRRRSCVHHRPRSSERASCTAVHLRQLQAQSGQSRPVAA